MKNLKQLLIPLFLCGFFLSACKKDQGSNSDLSGNYAILLEQTLAIPEKDSEVTLLLRSITDSRCPINADCVNAGSAVVNVLVKGPNLDKTLTLCLGDCNTAAPTFKYQGATYDISLRQLSPYPSTITSNALPTNATIEISKQ